MYSQSKDKAYFKHGATAGRNQIHSIVFFLQSQKRVYIIINATKRRGGKTCVIEPPLPKVLTIIDQIHLGEIWHERTYKFQGKKDIDRTWHPKRSC